MTIRVSPAAADLAGDLASRFLVVVTGADDAQAALEGLDEARAQLAATDGAVLSPVVLSPDGPLLRVAELPDDGEAEDIPDLVANTLEEAGVGSATVEVREPVGPLDRLDRTARAAVLRCFPPPAGADGVLPAAWLEVALEWVLGDLAATDHVQLRLLGGPFDVRAADAPALLHAAAASRAWCDLVQGDLTDRIRTASLTFGNAPHLALGAGGPRCDVPALLARFELLCDVARDLRPAPAYACIDLEPDFEQIGAGLTGPGWPSHGGAPANAVVSRAGDVVVPDAYPFQLLGPGHAARLAERGHDPLGTPLDDGRLELALGDAVGWLPEHEAREDALEHGIKALHDLLVTEAELTALVADRPRSPAAGTATTPASLGGPDLAEVTLDALPHPRRGIRLTLLELAAWLGQEPHSDAPTSVSPVLAAYARWLASGLDHASRQALKPMATRLLGTRAPGLSRGPWRPLAPEDDRRAWAATDWLARTQAPAWLRAAGLGDLAKPIERVRPRAKRQHVEHLLELLSAALQALAELAVPVDEGAWEAWERAAEATGWVAASEAAWVGVPDVLASAAELRANELVRDPRAAGERGRAPEAIAVGTSAAARLAVAEAAWRAAGRAAGTAIDAVRADPTASEAGLVPLTTAVERAMQGAPARLGIDRDALEQDLETADVAAIGSLVDVVRSGRPPAGALEAARAAAAASAGGDAWEAVQEMTRGVIGDEAWDAGLAAGRTAATRVLHHARPLVERAVLVSLARETAGSAARLAAVRGTAAALEPVVDQLRPVAVLLLEDLLVP